MTDILLLIYPVLIFIATFYGAKISAKGEFAEDHLKLEQTKMIQAFACLFVILHHITQQITQYGTVSKGPITMIDYCGIMFTALFFFFSGFGLMTSLMTKEGYLDTFLTKRLPTVLIPFWIINLLGVLLSHFGYGVRYSVGEALSDIFGLTLVNSNGWFIVEIVILYLIFYVLFRNIKNRDVALILMVAATALIIAYSFFKGHDPEGNKAHWFKGEWWFNSTATFAFGLIYARFKTGIERFCKKHYKVMLAVFTILLLISLYMVEFAVKRYGYYTYSLMRSARKDAFITLMIQIPACLISTMFVILLNMRITLGNRVIKYFSTISVELFLIHGYFVNRIFGGVRMNYFLRYPVVYICSIACTAALSPLIKLAVDNMVILLNNKKIINDTLEAKQAEEKRKKRNKIFKIVFLTLAVIVAGLWLYLTVGRYMLAGREYEEERRAFESAKEGDKVYWGYCDQDMIKPGKERIEWIVIAKEADRICLMSEYGLAGSSYNSRHEAVTWEESELRDRLNSDEFLGMFSRYEIEDIAEVDGDLITLLTADQAESLFESDRERELVITEAAEVKGTNINRLSKDNQWDMKGYRSSWWWLKGEKDNRSVTAPIVTVDGAISYDQKEVNRPGGAIRPVIWLRMD